MSGFRACAYAATMLAVCACTPGGVTPSGLAGIPVRNVVTVDVNLAKNGLAQTPAGPALGFAPEVTTLSVGDGVRFVNSDNAAHTASSVPGSVFPPSSPLQFDVTMPSSDTRMSSGTWTSGTLQPGTSSEIFVADQAGVYLYGCFYHYSASMRGAIVAR